VGAKAGDPFVLGGAGAKATGEDDGRSNGRRGSRDRENPLGILGIMAASLAVTAAVPAAAGAITPAVLMFTGVSMVMARINHFYSQLGSARCCSLDHDHDHLHQHRVT
jgi:hypothetical protein